MTESYWDRAFFAALHGLCAHPESNPDSVVDNAIRTADLAAETLHKQAEQRATKTVVQIIPAAPGWRTAWVDSGDGTIHYQCIAAWALAHKVWDLSVDEAIYPVVVVEGAFMGMSFSRGHPDDYSYHHDLILCPGEDISQEEVDEIQRRERRREGSA